MIFNCIPPPPLRINKGKKHTEETEKFMTYHQTFPCSKRGISSGSVHYMLDHVQNDSPLLNLVRKNLLFCKKKK